MHISEGVLSAPVLISGGVLAAAGTAVGLKSFNYDHLGRVGILSATFFVASLVHVPIGPSSVHLILNGIVGLLLGWASFPAILVALLLQAVFFSSAASPPLASTPSSWPCRRSSAFYLFTPLMHRSRRILLVGGFSCGFCAVLFGALLVGLALMFTEENFLAVATLVVTAHLPVMIIEGIVTAFCVAFLRKVQPSMLP